MRENARIFLGSGSGEGDEMCCCCGMTRARKHISKALKPSFTDFSALIKFPSQYICDSCLELYDCKDMRFKPIYSDKAGSYRVIERQDVLKILEDPPKKFVLSVPYSFKKHHWLYAEMSSDEIACVGTDDRTVIFDYRRNDIPKIIGCIGEMLDFGIPRGEIISGNYSIFTLNKFPGIEKFEDIISPVRHSGAVELIVKYTPAVKEKKVYEKKEDNIMLTSSEINAVNLLSSIAENSAYRIENGISFWGGFFERRINRFKTLSAKEFVEKVTAAVGAKEGIWTNMLKDLSDSELEEIMQDIRSKTHILVAIVYGERSKK